MSDRNQELALLNLSGSIDVEQHFPGKVFRGAWNTFLFFDPDRLFEASFAEVARSLIDGVGGSCVCMCNLDEAARISSFERASIFLNRGTDPQEYKLRLLGTGPADGWLYAMERYGCVGDTGGWSIYCEKNNEIAVMAVRPSVTLDCLGPVVERLKAQPIGKALDNGTSYGLSARALSSEWRSKLMLNYVSIG